MNYDAMREAADHTKDHRRRKTWKRVLICLALVVVLGTAYTLMLPAITMEDTAYCGIEAHEHSADCYTRELVCGLEESEGHTHSEACIQRESVLTCENTDPEHVHTDACYTVTETYICGLEEGEGHVHTDACYADVLICGLEEHTHTDSCYSNPHADVETETDWEATLSDVELTGDWAEDVLTVAESQLGYAESTKNFVVTDDGVRKGYTRYGAWYGDPYGDWCAMYVSFCLHYAGVPDEAFPPEAGCVRWVEKLQEQELYAAAGDYTPQPGDLVFFDWNGDGKADHVGLVLERTEKGELRTIEGNSSNRVQKLTYTVDDKILGYGILPVNPEQEETAFPATQKQPLSLVTPALLAAASVDANEGGSTTVNVTKVWSDSGHESARPASVTMRLLRDGTDTGQTLTLTADDADGNGNWTGSFTGLADGHTYTVSEDTVTGYTVRYAYETETGAQQTAWLKADTLTAGETYVLAFDNNTKAMRYYNGALGTRNITVEGDRITTTLGTAVQWKAVSSGGNILLQNGNGTSYLTLSYDGSNYSWGASTTGTAITYNGNSNGGISSTTNSRTRYIQYSNGSFTAINNRSSADATPFTLYKLTNLAETTVSCRVTNTYSGGGGGGSTPTPTQHDLKMTKTIDAFRDGTDNPDTTLDTTAADTTDLYRLYLTAGPWDSSQPVDVLFVIDASGSMDKTDVTYKGTTYARDDAVTMVLNGTLSSGASLNDGLINTLISLNADNRYAAIKFFGNTSASRTASAGYSYETDSAILCGWTSNVQFVDASNNYNNGTNYEAGLLRAGTMFDNPTVANDGRKKVMIFISDGVPTLFIKNDDAGDSTITSYQRNNSGGTTSVTYGDSVGTGSFGTSYNVTQCREPTKRAFDTFLANYPDVITYTIGVSEDIDGTSISESQSPEVLRYMAETGGGTFTGVADADSFDQELRNIIGYYDTKNLAIQDTLSDYVDLYTDQVDLLLTETDKDGKVTVLWDANGVTNAGKGIVQSVGVEPDGKTVKAVFVPTYKASTTSVYTLSFNVQTTKQAYIDYAANAAAGDPYGGVTGDAGTDYGDNATSSKQPGFYSNASASLIFSRDDQEPVTFYYDRPVIQAADGKLTIVKQDANDKSKLLPGAHFALYRNAQEGETGTPVTGLDGSYVLVAQGETGTDGILTFSNLVPTNILGVTYYLVETQAPEGYDPLTEPVVLPALDRHTGADASIVVDDGSEPIPILNGAEEVPFELPETGGVGLLPFMTMGLSLMGVAVLFVYGTRQKQKRRSE